MEYVKLGATGLEVSRFCLGCMTYGSPGWREWVLDHDRSRPLLRRALEAGINFFDTADMYSRGASEEIVGAELRDLARRDEIVLATKVYYPLRDAGPNRMGLSRKRIFDSIDASLRRLGTDYVDLYQVHRHDPDTPLDETLEALGDVVRSGRARYVGASSMFAWQFARALYRAENRGLARFVSMQNHYNLVYREEEREMLPLCRSEGVAVIPYSPLARGFLAGNRTRGSWEGTVRARTDAFGGRDQFRDCDFEVVERVREVAAKHGASPARVSLAWLLARPGVTAPILGVSRPEQLDDALGALALELDTSELERLDEPYQPRRGAGFL